MQIRSLAAGIALASIVFAPLLANAATPQPAGGSNQRPSLEGCIGQTLFNGIWRLKVLESALKTNPDDADSKNWAITLELRNGRNAQTSPGDTGFQDYPQLAFADDTVLDMETTDAKVQYQKAIYYKDVPPGGAARMTMWYRLDGEHGTKTPTKLLIAIKATEYGKKFGYSVPDPSFRVKLDCNS
ncbi:MAG: hypothetical protein M3Z14_00360 [Candidatus Eremiobacteraeota bacterium]|nr:hypothetical protein [Candidatus Eremiobacteraeota bacterium]